MDGSHLMNAERISIRAPARGATFSNRQKGGVKHISIRAPARGATSVRTVSQKQSSDFNPRSREGSDLDRKLKAINQNVFQSALPRGERRSTNSQGKFGNDFNPRSREGSDISKCAAQPVITISIRAPARGATAVRSALICSMIISIRAPARGATIIQTQ